MAIVQVSKITHRKGLSDDLPQLAGAELGWALDDRKLYIGNGTLAEGAPAVGNTEILTEYSDLLSMASGYTYKGTAGGYVVQTGETSSVPTQRPLQAKLDDFASIRDFGAVGDGVTDDTDAINRALYQIFCRDTNEPVRRSIYFPAGVYKITDTILIPPYAKIFGEGADSTIIRLDTSDYSSNVYVARTCDSLRQIDANIGANGAIIPKNIEISSLSFEAADVGNVFLVQLAQQMHFDSVNFTGSLVQANLSGSGEDIAGIHFDSSVAIVTNQITIDKCKFSGLTYGIQTNERIQGVTVSNCKFDTLYRGILLGGTPVNGGPQGVRILHNLFNNIAYEGIVLGNIALNVSAYNIFLNVATNFQGGEQTPVSSIISITGANNVSIGDMFERSEAYNITSPRVSFNATNGGFALDNAQRYKFGSYSRNQGKRVTLSTQSSATEIFAITTGAMTACKVEYQFKDPDTSNYRSGILNIAAMDADDSTGSLTYTDDYVENTASGLTLSVAQSGSNISIKYTLPAGSPSVSGTFYYSITNFS